MATTDHPITTPPGLNRVGLDPAQPPSRTSTSSAASGGPHAPGCGYELAEGRRQDKVERKAARRTCPICVEVA